MTSAGYSNLHPQTPSGTCDATSAAVALAREHGFTLWATLGIAPQGWARADQGHSSEGIALIRQSLAEYQATGSQAIAACFVALLAEGYLRVGQAEDGLTLVAEALAAARDPGHFYQGELRRLKGELLFLLATRAGREGRVSGDSARLAEVEACFRQVLDIARRQEAKSLELRAAMSLSRLWKEQGRHDGTRTLLADVYGWFTEGFDTADLCEARALLAVGRVWQRALTCSPVPAPLAAWGDHPDTALTGCGWA